MLLQVDAIIKSYKIADLLAENREGSRQWLYDEANAWLDKQACVRVADGTLGPPAGQHKPDARMFLLLADAGMGKSVFSAKMEAKLTVRTNTKAVLMVSSARTVDTIVPSYPQSHVGSGLSEGSQSPRPLKHHRLLS